MANISYGVNILPKTNNAYTLGNSDYKWSNIFTNQINGTDVATIISGGSSSSNVDISGKVDKTALLDAGVTNSTYSTAFGGTFTVTTATDNDHTIPYAKATPTGTIDKYKRFRVTINDTEYVMESGIWFISNKYYNYLGNLTKIYDHAAWIPGGIIDVPFLITFDRDNNSSIEVWTTTAGTYTIKIETITDTFKKLPSELIYGSAYPPILQCKNEGSTFSGYSLGVNILRDRRGTMAFGYGNELVADFALAIGTAHSISGENATAVGYNNSIHSNLDTSLGAQNIMYGSSPYSTTVGMGNTIYSNSSQSGTFGQRNTIEPYSQYAHALGYWNICDGKNAYAIGYSNSAFSDQTMAIGNGTTASAKDQIVLGTLNTLETADAWVASTSYAVGDIVYKNNRLYKCITANSDSSFTSSKWERCRGQFLEILGNGDLGTLNRSNARATDWNGNTYIKGNLYIGCNADSSGGTRVPHDIQVNGTSIVSNGIATIPLAAAYQNAGNPGHPGLVHPSADYGTKIEDNVLAISGATETDVKTGTTTRRPLTPLLSKNIVFYGLAKAAGDSTQSASSNAIGTYTADAKSAIQSMLAVAPTASPIFTGSISLGRATNTTVGTNSFAVGDGCEASAEEAHAEGRYTTASGYYSHAEGNYTFATGMAAHAEGTVTIANHASQHAFGEYNVPDSSVADAWNRGNYIEIVGNGTASNAQSNARALDWSGNEYLKGDLYIGCDADSDNGTKVATITQLPSTMTGATSSAAGSGGLVPAPATTDVDKFLAGDGTYKSGGLPMVILSYGSSTWADFEAAYNNNVIVYCRASSNSNPASGSQTRMAFMAYVNNSTTPTEVEFQYYRSMSSHSATAMGDQVFVYKLTKTGGWSVTTRDASIKEINVASGSKLGVSWSSNKVTLSNTMTADDMPMSSSDATTTKAAIDTLNSKIIIENQSIPVSGFTGNDTETRLTITPKTGYTPYILTAHANSFNKDHCVYSWSKIYTSGADKDAFYIEHNLSSTATSIQAIILFIK